MISVLHYTMEGKKGTFPLFLFRSLTTKTVWSLSVEIGPFMQFTAVAVRKKGWYSSAFLWFCFENLCSVHLKTCSLDTSAEVTSDSVWWWSSSHLVEHLTVLWPDNQQELLSHCQSYEVNNLAAHHRLHFLLSKSFSAFTQQTHENGSESQVLWSTSL